MEKEAPKDAAALMVEVKALRERADQLEVEAMTMALGVANGNITQAAIIAGVSPGFIRNAFRDGRRLAALKPLATRKRGRPPILVETIAQEAKAVPKALAKAMPLTKGGKLPPLPQLAAGSRFSEEQRKTIARAWLDCKAAKAQPQKDFAAQHGIGVSTLREWVSAL